MYEIDHIIPNKYFHDDSFSNKVLTSFANNREKAKRTPFEWLGSQVLVWYYIVVA
ncbi:hypothetical protein IJR75_02400 [bacterium]|nr:hypothetical protein [bacterium]